MMFIINLCEQAEDFHKKGHSLLDWLSGAERQLRYRGAIPDEEEPLLKQIDEHKVIFESMIFPISEILHSNLFMHILNYQVFKKICDCSANSSMIHKTFLIRFDLIIISIS